MRCLCVVVCRRFAVICLVGMLGVLGACASDGDSDPPDSSPQQARAGQLTAANSPADVCGMKVLPSPAVFVDDPCETGRAVAIQPGNGHGNHAGGSFKIDAASRLCILLDSSGGAGSVKVDGQHIPYDRRQPDRSRYTLRLEAGSHQLRVNGHQAGASLKVMASKILPGQDVVEGDNGVLELSGVGANHPMFSPNGDQYHDTTLFVAENFPRSLPGEASGQFEYFLNWSWKVTRADTCTAAGPVVTGRTQVHSPTHVEAWWDGTAPMGAPALSRATTAAAETQLQDGSYIYQYQADLVRSDGLVIDSVASRPHGVLMNSKSSRWPSNMGVPTASGVSHLTNADLIETCDPSHDPDGCLCPDPSTLDEGERCTYSSISSLEDFSDPDTVPTDQFLTRTQNTATGNWQVTVDLRTYNGGGLVPQSDGEWADVDELRDYVADLTGVEPDPDYLRLFNFDFVQLGYSTPVNGRGAVTGFNHFLLDVITDENGVITIDNQSYDLQAIFQNGNTSIPSRYDIDDERDGDECTHNGNTNGVTDIMARTCTRLRMVNFDPGHSNLGIYRIGTNMFEYTVNGETTTRESHCTSSGCGVRTIQIDAEEMGAERTYYTEVPPDTLDELEQIERGYNDTPSILIESDREFSEPSPSLPLDGICSSGIVSSYDSMDIPLDSADGALPEVCVIDGIASPMP